MTNRVEGTLALVTSSESTQTCAHPDRDSIFVALDGNREHLHRLAEQLFCQITGRAAEASEQMPPSLPFSQYVESRARTFTDIGTFFERVRRDLDFLAIKTRRDMESYCERKDLKVGEHASVRQIWRYYEQALRRAELAEPLTSSRTLDPDA